MQSSGSSPETASDSAPGPADELAVLRSRVQRLEAELASRSGASSHDSMELEAARALLAFTGKTFFRSLLEHLCAALDTEYAFVAEPVEGQPTRVRALAVHVDGAEGEPFEYALSGTPCEQVWSEDLRVYTSGVQEAYPQDTCLKRMGIIGYAGVPLRASDGHVIGHLAVMARHPLQHACRTEVLLRIFAARAAAELDRLQAEERLRRSEALLRSILDHSVSSIYVKDLEGRYLLVNREFERASGFPTARAVGATPYDLLPVADAARIEDHEAQVVRQRVPMRREITLPLPGRGERSFIIDKAPLFGDDGQVCGTCTIATDVTENKRLEAQLVRNQRLESIGQLAGGVAHDFNNLLTAIGGFTAMALESLPLDHPARRELGEALRAGDRAAALTRQLLAFARKQVIQPRDVDLVAVVHDMRSFLRPVLGDHVRLGVRLAPGLWPVHVDRGQLEQVLVNLAINARDAMPEGGLLEITASNTSLVHDRAVQSGVLPAGNYVEIRVRDEGEGVPDDVRPHVFEPFFTTKAGGKGSGLGLATCHGIIAQSGGHIEFESAPGEGTTFIVLLPRGKGVPAEPAVPPAPDPSSGQETVLIVEDEPLVRELAVRSLSQAGFRVLEAADGAAALRCAAGWPGSIGLLLTDVMMPGMNGLELAERLHAVRPETRVLLMSGYPEAALARRHPDDGVWPLLQKPYTPRELSARVRQALDAVTA